jgi:hypothetical protein
MCTLNELFHSNKAFNLRNSYATRLVLKKKVGQQACKGGVTTCSDGNWPRRDSVLVLIHDMEKLLSQREVKNCSPTFHCNDK